MGTTIALGIFDGVHTGHRRVLENAAGYAAEHGAKAAVCTFDTSTISTKGADFLPIYSDEIKREKIQALGITEIHSLDFTKVRDISSESFITDILVSQLHAENVVCGLDFRFGRHASGGIEELEKAGQQLGFTLTVTDDVSVGNRKISSSRIRTYIREGNIKTANLLLGDTYFIRGEVIHGNRIGTKMNYPTANIALDEKLVMPRYGVYAVYSEINGRRAAGAANVGVKPTVGSDRPLCEVHFFDDMPSLYGDTLDIHFVDFIRPEMRFDGVDSLFEQIHYDEKIIRKILSSTK